MASVGKSSGSWHKSEGVSSGLSRERAITDDDELNRVCGPPSIVAERPRESFGKWKKEVERGPFCPIYYRPDGTFEELPPLGPQAGAPPSVEGQAWENVEPSWPSVSRIKSLLQDRRAAGVTFIIPRDGQRPWDPRLLFPIP